MSWFNRRKKFTFCEQMCVSILKCGTIPKHIAVIMDGNRRFAVRNSLHKIDGHTKGFEKMAELLSWCLEIGIKEVTVYAFSIENFKRGKDEVEALMDLAREKFQKLMEEKEEIDRHGVCIRILGDTSLLPMDIQTLIADVTLMSHHHRKLFLNICFSYTSREEICQAVNRLVGGVEKENVQPNDITEEAISKCLYTGCSENPEPDLLIRTSGEVRLSDFLLWQTGYSCLTFIPVLWPDITSWHFFAAIFYYQVNYRSIKVMKSKHLAWRYQENWRFDEENALNLNTSDAHGNGVLSANDRDAVTRQRTVKRERCVKDYVNSIEKDHILHLTRISSTHDI